MAPGSGSKKRSSTKATPLRRSPRNRLRLQRGRAGAEPQSEIRRHRRLARPDAPASTTRSSPGATGRSGSRTSSARITWSRRLRNAIRLNRLAQAYLFCGTRGVGKTSMARIFAKCLNCVQRARRKLPARSATSARRSPSGQDVDVIEIDGASNNGVEQVRELRQNASLRPSRSRYKIYYIDEVHMLSTGAFNALLKTLEEPPPHVKFFFATTEANKIPITVLSRCQRYDFAGITPEAIVNTLAEICTAGAGRGRARGASGRRPPGGRLDARRPVAARAAAGLRQPAADRRGGPHAAGNAQRRAAADDARGPGRPRPRRGALAARPGRRRGGATHRPPGRRPRVPPRRDGALRGRRGRPAGRHARVRSRGSRGSSIAGRSTRFSRPSRSSPKPVPGCAALLTADCSRNWLWSALPGWRT